MTSSACKSAMDRASFSAGVSLPMAGPWPPTLDVVKNTGSIRAKSFSAIIRSISTEPTMPRQPTKPTRFIIAVP
jgi:hypothetical protein